MKKKLSELRPGDRAVIVKFEDDETYIKLMEMGCLPGESILLDQVAPLGGPIRIRVSGYSLSLRKDEAESIEVEILH